MHPSLQETLLNFLLSVSIMIEVSSFISNIAWLKFRVVLFAKENANHAAGHAI